MNDSASVTQAIERNSGLLNFLIQGSALAVMIWVGTTLVQLAQDVAVLQAQVGRLENRLAGGYHVDDARAAHSAIDDVLDDHETRLRALESVR